MKWGKHPHLQDGETCPQVAEQILRCPTGQDLGQWERTGRCREVSWGSGPKFAKGMLCGCG